MSNIRALYGIKVYCGLLNSLLDEFIFLLQREVFKDPVTDQAKRSKKGRLTLEVENGRYVTKEQGTGDLNKVRFGLSDTPVGSIFGFLVFTTRI